MMNMYNEVTDVVDNQATVTWVYLLGCLYG